MCGWTSLFGDGMMVIQLAHGNHGDLGICLDVISMMGSQVKAGVSKAPLSKPRLNLWRARFYYNESKASMLIFNNLFIILQY